jgi:signal transduction histidine kinase
MASLRKLLGSKLYFRLWFAVILTIALLTICLGWINKVSHEPLPREITVRNDEGSIIAHGFVRKKPDSDTNDSEDTANRSAQPNEPQIKHGLYGPGSEFLVQTNEGAWLHIYLTPKTNRPFWNRHKYGWLWLLIIVGLSVSFATYPVIRRLTRRLENLQKSVAIWGAGDLASRASVEGHDEIAYLAEQFNASANQIEALVNAHKSLLANASHELRTPLARIRMALELMGESAPVNLKNEMTRNILELDQLIDEILTASRLDAPQSNMGAQELVDLTGLASEECSHKNAELDLGQHPQSYLTYANPQLLRRVIRNLLDNAEKHACFTPASAKDHPRDPRDITVQIRLDSDQPNARIRLSVLDRGPGVAKEEQSKIFEPFYRSTRTVKSSAHLDHDFGLVSPSSGAGLGLSLVKTICERHSGSVHYEDRPGGGSCFVVLLPNAA